jgi:hypothetical protein
MDHLVKLLKKIDKGSYKITEDFENLLCDYTGSPYAIEFDSQSNSLFLSKYYEKYLIQIYQNIQYIKQNKL